MEVSVTIPERHYDLAGSLLVRAIKDGVPGESVQDAALRVSAERGRAIGEDFRRERRLGRPGPERTISATQDLLEAYGYEPHRDTRAALALRNCPFHALAHQAPELVCGMNRSFIEGVVRGLGNDSVQAVLECTYGDCCVTVRAPGRKS